MPEVDKLCVLSFDEMKVAAAFEYDSSADVVYDPSNYVQLAIVRGLIKSWKQPVFFDFSTRMDVDTLHSIINKLHKRGYPEVAIVSDLGSGNQRLWRELGISENNHINIGSLAKQRVKLATQLFSNTTASSIRRCYALGYDVENDAKPLIFLKF
ncbi:hypothetical protein ACLKA6_016437 [Drosophila palustris]